MHLCFILVHHFPVCLGVFFLFFFEPLPAEPEPSGSAGPNFHSNLNFLANSALFVCLFVFSTFAGSFSGDVNAPGLRVPALFTSRPTVPSSVWPQGGALTAKAEKNNSGKRSALVSG